MSSSRKWLRGVSWTALAVGSLLFFSILKLPDARLKAYIHGVIAAQLGAQGITFTATESALGLLLGPRYTLRGVTLEFPPPRAAVKLDELTVKPSLLATLLGKAGGSISLVQGDSSLSGTVYTRFSGRPWYQVDLDFERLNLGRLGVFSAAAGVQASALLNGSLAGTFDLDNLKDSQGKVDLQITKCVIDAQNIQGFAVPRLSISESRVEASIQGDQVAFKTLKIGKAGSADDLIATLTGKATLNRFLASSSLDLTANFSVSQNIQKSFAILDALLAPGKQADGSYSYKLGGAVNALFPTPIPAK